jgi:hypothetical protein
MAWAPDDINTVASDTNQGSRKHLAITIVSRILRLSIRECYDGVNGIVCCADVDGLLSDLKDGSVTSLPE